MIHKKLRTILVSIAASIFTSLPVSAAVSTGITMENSGAYLFEWRPIDCGNGTSFAILVGGNTINESNVILNRGYDYAYTFEPQTYQRPWGTAPDLVNINGLWGIPENWASMPEGSQPTLQIVLKTNNKNLDTDKRYIHVVHLPDGVNTADLPPEVRKYLINVDGSDAGAYDGTETSGWVEENGQWKYRKPDGTFVTGGWLNVDEESYYMTEEGYMLADTTTPDGIYVNAKGEKTNYIPGWIQADNGWRYIKKNGHYASAGWIQDTDGKWYYFNIAAYMETDDVTPDGYYVDANGVWDGQAATSTTTTNLGPGVSKGWEPIDTGWKFKQEDGTYLTNSWKQDTDGKWYYLNEDGWMLKDTTTPDGYYVDENGIWVQ
ncbi:MAG: choline-binding protein [Clostridiales bacterium]|nr:choline-binding protein [Clostridiales bacterium]